MADIRLRAIIDASVDRLKRALGIAKGDIKDFGKAAKKAGDDGSQSMAALATSITGMGSKMAVITKGFQSMKQIIMDYVVEPMKEAYKYATEIAKQNSSSAGGAASDAQKRISGMRQDLQAYRELVRGMDGSNASEEKRRQAAAALDRKYGTSISSLSGGLTGEALDREIAAQLGHSQSSMIGATETYIKNLMQEQQKLNDDILNPKGYRPRALVSESDIASAQARSTEITSLLNSQRELLQQLKKEDWRGDYIAMQGALDADARAKRSLAYEGRLSEFAKGGGTYGSFGEEEAAIRREAKALDHLAETEEQRADVRKAFDQRMADAAERWSKTLDDEDRKRQDSFTKQMQTVAKSYGDLAKAQRDYVDAVKALAKTERDIRDDRRREREDERLAALEKKRASYGFSIAEGFSLHESQADRRKRLARKALDASIGEKMAQWEEGRSVRWTTRERRRLAGAQGVLDEQERIESRRERRERKRTEESRTEAIASAVGAVASARMGVIDYSATLQGMSLSLQALATAATQNVYFVR